MPVKLSFIIQNIVNHIIADLAVIDISIGIRQKTLDHRRLVTLKALSFLYIVTLVSKVFPLEMVKICLIVQAVTQSFYPGHLYHGMGIQTNVIDRKSKRLNSSHYCASRMPSSA